MPYPTTVVGDAVVWVDSGGVYIPALVSSAGSRNGTNDLIAFPIVAGTPDVATPTIVLDALYSEPTDGISEVSTWHWPQES